MVYCNGYDEYFEEPSEYEEKVDELKNALYNAVKEEIKEELKTLREENAELRAFEKNYDEKMRKLDAEKEQLERDKQNYKQELDRKKGVEIFKSLTSCLWEVKNVGKLRPKCDKCDECGYIHFVSPQGRKCTELCDCRTELPYFKCEKSEVERISIKDGKLNMYFHVSEHMFDAKEYHAVGSLDKLLYDGRPYEEWYHNQYKVNHERMYFDNEEEAKKFTEWLNKRMENKYEIN